MPLTAPHPDVDRVVARLGATLFLDEVGDVADFVAQVATWVAAR